MRQSTKVRRCLRKTISYAYVLRNRYMYTWRAQQAWGWAVWQAACRQGFFTGCRRATTVC